MNYRDYQPQQKELFGYRPEDVLEEGHLAFFIDEMVENLSIESFYDRTQNAGNPAYDPRIMLKLLFLGYAIGITSSRKLQHQCQENLAFIYLTRGEKPKFRAICEFRIKHSENIKELFPQMVQIAQKLNIVKIGRLILDGTKIRANANSKRTIKAEKYDDILKSIEDYLLLSKHQDNEEDIMYGKDQIESFLPKEILSKTNRVERLKEIIQQAKKNQLKKVNATDPEAKFMRDTQTNKKKPAYNVQIAVDADSGVIVTCEATDSTNDNEQLEPMVDKVIKEQGIKPEKVDADSGYYSNESVDALEAQHIDTCIPDPVTANRLHRSNSNAMMNNKKYTQEDFTYNTETDTYICPQGITLSHQKSYKAGQRTIRIFRSDNDCTKCPDRDKCITMSKKAKYKTLHIDPVSILTKEKFKQDTYKKRYKERSWIIERIFGHFKKNLRFTQFNLRGLRGAAIETTLLCIGYNLFTLQHWLPIKEIGHLVK